MTLFNNLSTSAIKAALRMTFKPATALPVPLFLSRIGLELGARLFPVNREVSTFETTLGGTYAEWLVPRVAATASAKVILHLHGGAFFAGSARSHRALGSEIAARSGHSIYMLDYPRAPEHPYPIPLNAARYAYDTLLALGYRPEQIVLGGDSGGCTLAMLLCLSLRDEQQPMPGGVYLISPYVDLTQSAASYKRNRHIDPMVARLALTRGGKGFRGKISPFDGRVSPVFADLSGLPPLLIQAGSSEILLDDATLLAKKARAAQVEVDLQIYEGMWHNFQMFNMAVPEANTALDKIASFINQLPVKSAQLSP